MSQSPETAQQRRSNLDAVMVDINDLGQGTPEYHEALWFLLTIMTRRQALIAESLRLNARKRERAAATRRRNQGGDA